MSFKSRVSLVLLAFFSGALVHAQGLSEHQRRIIDLQIKLSKVDRTNIAEMRNLMLEIHQEQARQQKLEEASAPKSDFVQIMKHVNNINTYTKKLQSIENDPVLSAKSKEKFTNQYSALITAEVNSIQKIQKRKDSRVKLNDSSPGQSAQSQENSQAQKGSQTPENRQTQESMDLRLQQKFAPVYRESTVQVYLRGEHLGQDVQVARRDLHYKGRKPASWVNPRDAEIINHYGLPDTPAMTTEQELKAGVR